MTFEGKYDGTTQIGNQCTPCPADHICKGGTSGPYAAPQDIENNQCGTDYVGSLYHKLVRYAMQTCVRPSESNSILPTNILQDVNVVMTQLRTDMSNALSRECERLGGIWVDTPWVDLPNKTNNTQTTGDGFHDVTGQTLYTVFYAETSANTQWGFCASESATMAQSTP